ncbi:AroM family protein [Streptomyces antimycoticus]|uniref:AroM family protein n=1 Tax=Streptomyces antimycoticus TaxID=68175 RepID=UPI0022400CF1|nr:AroM family protein [Streptomyces antimycoticus]
MRKDVHAVDDMDTTETRETEGPEHPAGAPALGLVTIGQAPRADLRPDAEPLLPGVRLVEHGALDAERFDGDAEAATRRLLAPRTARHR